jgi:hypothetical protein
MYSECIGGNVLEVQTLAQTEQRDAEAPFDPCPSKGDRIAQANADWALLEKDLPSEPRLRQEAYEQLSSELIGHLIQDYELIIQRGLPPAQAIASVIGWASGECRRIRS